MGVYRILKRIFMGLPHYVCFFEISADNRLPRWQKYHSNKNVALTNSDAIKTIGINTCIESIDCKMNTHNSPTYHRDKYVQVKIEKNISYVSRCNDFPLDQCNASFLTSLNSAHDSTRQKVITCIRFWNYECEQTQHTVDGREIRITSW